MKVRKVTMFVADYSGTNPDFEDLDNELQTKLGDFVIRAFEDEEIEVDRESFMSSELGREDQNRRDVENAYRMFALAHIHY